MANYTPHLHRSEDGQYYSTLNYGKNVVYTSETVPTEQMARKPFKTLYLALTDFYVDHTGPKVVKRMILTNKIGGIALKKGVQ